MPEITMSKTRLKKCLYMISLFQHRKTRKTTKKKLFSILSGLSMLTIKMLHNSIVGMLNRVIVQIELIPILAHLCQI